MQDFHPVIIGSDIGTYALARSFHEAYGKTSSVVASQILGPIAHSRIIQVFLEKDYVMHDVPYSALVQALLTLGPQLQRTFAGQKLLLIANADTYVRDLVSHYDVLSTYYTFAAPSFSLLQQVNDKEVFPSLIKQYGLQTPLSCSVDLADEPRTVLDQIMDNHELAVNFATHALILKPVLSSGYEKLSWPGKYKVYTAHSQDELFRIISDLHVQALKHEEVRRFLVQRRVEGNDSYNLSITAYVDESNRVTLLGSAHVLLEDHVPTALGNPACMITESYPKIYQKVCNFLTGIQWRGFANFDLKIDEHTHELYCFEMNPRIGRNLYYNTASGLNPMRVLVADMIEHRAIETQRLKKSICYSVLPPRLALRYLGDSSERALRTHIRRGSVYNPLYYPFEFGISKRGLLRFAYVSIAYLNYWRKFYRDFPPSVAKTTGTTWLDTTDVTL